MNLNKYNVFVSILLIIMLIMLFNFNDKINKLSDRSNYNKQELHRLIEYDINGLESIIKSETNSEWVDSVSYKFIGFTDDEERVVTEFEVSFNELYNSSKVFLNAINRKDINDNNKIELEQDGYLKFRGNIELDINKNYSLEILSENEIMNKKDHLMYLDLMYKIKNRNIFRVTQIGYDSNNNLSFSLSLENNHYGIYGGFDEFKLTNIELNLYKGNTLLEHKNITNLMQKDFPNDQVTIYMYSDELKYEGEDNLFIEIIYEDKLGTQSSRKLLYQDGFLE